MRIRDWPACKNLSILFIPLLFLSVDTLAIEAKGVAQVPYSFMLDKDEKRLAETKALQSAVETWISTEQQSHYRNYAKTKEDIDSHIEDYILRYTVIDSQQDSSKKTYKIIVRAEINEPKLINKLLSVSEKEPGNDQAFSDEQEYITFVFVAREQAGKSTRSEKQAASSKSSSKGIGKDIAETSANMTKSASQSIGMKESSTQYADTILWKVSTSNEINVAMGDVFTNANFLVIDADYLEEDTGYLLEVDNFIKDYEQGDDLKSTTKRDALKGLKSLADPVQYLAIGTLDIDEQMVDSVTGQIKVPVSVTAQVLSVQKRGAAVAKVGPVQYIGLGPTVTVAKNNALKLAAEEAAKSLVGKLSSKSIR